MIKQDLYNFQIAFSEDIFLGILQSSFFLYEFEKDIFSKVYIEFPLHANSRFDGKLITTSYQLKNYIEIKNIKFLLHYFVKVAINYSFDLNYQKKEFRDSAFSLINNLEKEFNNECVVSSVFKQIIYSVFENDFKVVIKNISFFKDYENILENILVGFLKYCEKVD